MKVNALRRGATTLLLLALRISCARAFNNAHRLAIFLYTGNSRCPSGSLYAGFLPVQVFDNVQSSISDPGDQARQSDYLVTSSMTCIIDHDVKQGARHHRKAAREQPLNRHRRGKNRTRSTETREKIIDVQTTKARPWENRRSTFAIDGAASGPGMAMVLHTGNPSSGDLVNAAPPNSRSLTGRFLNGASRTSYTHACTGGSRTNTSPCQCQNGWPRIPGALREF